MNFTGIVIGAATFLAIGVFHPIVIKVEYYLGKRSWWLFLLLGIACVVGSLFTSGVMSILFGVLGFSSFWSIPELIKQHTRVEKGWFPKGPGHCKC